MFTGIDPGVAPNCVGTCSQLKPTGVLTLLLTLKVNCELLL